MFHKLVHWSNQVTNLPKKLSHSELFSEFYLETMIIMKTIFGQRDVAFFILMDNMTKSNNKSLNKIVKFNTFFTALTKPFNLFS